MDRTGDQTTPPPLCERNVKGVTCAKSPDGGPAQAVDQVNGRWYCKMHIGAAKAVGSKRRDRGFGTCSLPGCSRPAVEREGKCNEHRAGERASDATVVIVDDGSGRGDHPYAPKRSEIYLAVFPELDELRILKVGKATPWTVRDRVNDAADKLRIRRRDNGTEQPITSEPVAWTIPLFGDRTVLWAVSERVEHAATGRLAHNVGATPSVTPKARNGCVTMASATSTGRTNFTGRCARRSPSSATPKRTPATRDPCTNPASRSGDPRPLRQTQPAAPA